MATLTDNRPVAALAAVHGHPWLAAGGLCRRELVRFWRQPNRLFGAIGQPLVFWILFGAGLGPSFQAPGTSGKLSFAEYFFPGTIALIVLFTAIFTTISLIEDRKEGFLQSVLVAPIPRWSMVLGKISGGALIALAEGLVFLLLGFFAGIRVGPLALASATLFLSLVSLSLTALGFVFAWRTDSTQGFHAVMSVVLFPMWLLSGAFFPAESGLLGWIVRLNPLTYGVAGLRRLLYLGVQNPPLPAGLPSLATCWIVTLLFTAVMVALATAVASRTTKADLV